MKLIYIAHRDKCGLVAILPQHGCGNERIAAWNRRAAVRIMQRGNRDDGVKVLQTMLTAKGFSCNGIDGIFGINTYNALLKFQRKVNIAADGLAGKNTMQKLFA